jgi:hypothetical protein
MDDPHEFSEEEIAQVTSVFPGLKLISKYALEGIIEFYKEDRDYRIKDSYKIAIMASKGYPTKIPLVFERGGRTQSIADRYHLKDIRDLHYNTELKSACVCVKQEEKIMFPPGSNLVDFINNLVIPYLYGLSYFEEQGRWPWGERSHGVLGLLEFYAESSDELTKSSIEEVSETFRKDPNWKEYSKQLQKPRKDRACPCGSKKAFSKCHSKAWQGLLNLKENLTRLGLKAYKLYRR